MLNNQEQQSKKFKVVFLGDQTVGKTSIIDYFSQDKIPNQYNPTIGIDFISKIVHLDGQNVRLQIWDTAGQERFRSLIPSYIRDSKAAVLCYDVENLKSFQNIQQWLHYVREERGSDILIILVANKIDVNQNRAVPLDQGASFALKNNMLYYECSAKEGINIQQLFKDIAIKLLSEQSANTQTFPQIEAPSLSEATSQQDAIAKEATPQYQIPAQPGKVEQAKKFKLAFLGDEAVGKTTIISQFALNQSIQKYEVIIDVGFGRLEIIQNINSNLYQRLKSHHFNF